MFTRSAKAGVEALETFAVCFADDHAPRVARARDPTDDEALEEADAG